MRHLFLTSTHDVFSLLFKEFQVYICVFASCILPFSINNWMLSAKKQIFVWLICNINCSLTEKKLQVYFKYTSFVLQILEFQQKYTLSELPKKKYKWSKKLSFKINTSKLKVYFKYTSEFEDKYIESLLHTVPWDMCNHIHTHRHTHK